MSSVTTTQQEGPVGPPHVHHMDATTAYHAAKLGMWLFLGTEILLFGGLFLGFAIYRWYYLDQFHAGSHHLNMWLGGTNTIVLLFSSLTAVLAVDAAQHGNNKRASKFLVVTLLCALAFLVIKYIEYSGKYHHGYFPGGEKFHEFGPFLPFYFCMTGLHALHVIFGMGLLGWVLSKTMKNRFSPDYYTPVEVGALYWHLVDAIWIYLFPLLYLVG